MIWKTLTNEQKAHLIKSVWREGITSAQIGMAVGATKNSIVGFYSRHRDMLEGYPLPLSVKEKSDKGILSAKTLKNDEYAENARMKRVNANVASIITTHTGPEFEAHDIPSTDGYGLYVTLADNNGCMWPLNDGGPYLFCGHAKLGKYAYCQHHHVRSLGVGTEGERRAHKLSPSSVDLPRRKGMRESQDEALYAIKG